MQPNEIKRTRKEYESVIFTVTGKNRGQTTAWYEIFKRSDRSKELLEPLTTTYTLSNTSYDSLTHIANTIILINALGLYL